MYDPAVRLHAFVDSQQQPHQQQPPQTNVSRDKRRAGPKQKIIVHVVNLVTMYNEIGVEHGSYFNTACEALAAKTTMRATGTAKTASAARTWAKTFGSGNPLVYVLSHNNDPWPQFLAVGVTLGAQTNDREVSGEWTVVTTFGTALTKRIVDSNSRLRWHVPPRTSVSHSFRSCCFAKNLVPKVWDIYAAIREARDDDDALDALVEANPRDTRLVLLMEMLFTWNEVSRQAFLHLDFVHAQSKNSGNP